MRTIGIDCRLAGIKHAGIGRYIDALVHELVKYDGVRFVLITESPDQLSDIPESAKVIKQVAPVRHYTLREQMVMPGVFGRAKLDLLHVPHFNIPLLYSGKMVVTIHDLLWHQQRGSDVTTLPPLTYALKYQAYRLITAEAAKRASVIFVPAQTVKQTILQYYPKTNPDKIIVTYEGVDPLWFREAKSSQPVGDKILFYTGSLYPHKNLSLVVEALRELPEYKLCISSSRTVFVDHFLAQVKAMQMEKRVEYLGRLSDEELREWYGKSVALVQPSISEGFGLTGVEAMAAGLPVLASDIPIFKEVYQDACVYFDPKTPSSLVAGVKSLEMRDRAKMIARGQQVAARYTWANTASQTFMAYRQLLDF